VRIKDIGARGGGVLAAMEAAPDHIIIYNFNFAKVYPGNL
jgi:hypothetical protein